MPTYTIRIYEEIGDDEPVRTVEVEADTADEAFEKVTAEASQTEKRFELGGRKSPVPTKTRPEGRRPPPGAH